MAQTALSSAPICPVVSQCFSSAESLRLRFSLSGPPLPHRETAKKDNKSGEAKVNAFLSAVRLLVLTALNNRENQRERERERGRTTHGKTTWSIVLKFRFLVVLSFLVLYRFCPFIAGSNDLELSSPLLDERHLSATGRRGRSVSAIKQ